MLRFEELKGSLTPQEFYYRTGKPLDPAIQLPSEFMCLLEIYEELNPSNVIEIGTAYGGTLRHFQRITPTANFLSLDVYMGNVFAKNTFHTTTFLEGNTANPEIFEKAKNIMPTADFLFIDGDHAFPVLRTDWEWYKTLIRPGGIVALHDINGSLGYDTRTLWEEIKNQGYKTREFCERDQLQGYGIGVVYL